jgi:hypothetical protein
MNDILRGIQFAEVASLQHFEDKWKLLVHCIPIFSAEKLSK